MTESVFFENDHLIIDHLSVKDKISVAYIAGLESDCRVDGVLNCLQLGARALTFAGDQSGASLMAETLRNSTESAKSFLEHLSKAAQESVEKNALELPKQIHRELEILRKDLEKNLDPGNAKSIISRLRSAMIEEYSKVTAKSREDLDLGNPLSPLSRLRGELDKKLEKQHEKISSQLADLVQQNAVRAATHSERSKSTRKGVDFESALETFLTSECRPRKDLLRRTGTETGSDGNMVGDFVIELNPSEAMTAKIVVEAKNASKSTSALIRELDKAMKNRSAAFGICVITDPSTITEAIVPFGDNKLLVRVSKASEDDTWDMLALSVALEGARWKTVMARTAAETLDVAKLRGDIESAFLIVNRVTEVKKRIAAGKTHLDGIGEFVDDLRRELLVVLERLQGAVRHPVIQDRVA